MFYRRLQLFSIVTIGSFFFLSVSCSRVEAAEPTVNISQQINIKEDRNAFITYELEIHNKSKQDLISRIEFSIPYKRVQIISVKNVSSYGLKEDTLNLNLFNSPVPTNSTRTISFTIKVTRFVGKQGDIRGILIKKVNSQFDINTFKTNVTYPPSWGRVAYSDKSLRNETLGNFWILGNDRVTLVWGHSGWYRLEYQIKKNNQENFFLRVPRESNFQDVYLDNYSGISSIYFDSENNAFIYSDTEAGDLYMEFIVRNFPEGEFDFNNSEDYDKDTIKDLDFPEMKSKETAKLAKEILRYLDTNFRLSKHIEISKAIENMEGSTGNLAMLKMIWLQKNNVPAFISSGYDGVDLFRQPDLRIKHWIYYKDGDEWKILEDAELSDIRIEIFRISDYSEYSEKRLSEMNNAKLHPNIEIVNNKAIQQTFDDSTIDYGNIIVNVNWEDGKMNYANIYGNLFMKNPTNRYLILDDLKVNDKDIGLDNNFNMRIGIVPGSSRYVQVKYPKGLLNIFDPSLDLDSEVGYKIADSAKISVANKDTVHQNPLTVFNIPFLLGVFPFSLIIIYAYKKYRPKLKFPVR